MGLKVGVVAGVLQCLAFIDCQRSFLNQLGMSSIEPKGPLRPAMPQRSMRRFRAASRTCSEQRPFFCESVFALSSLCARRRISSLRTLAMFGMQRILPDNRCTN
jgi:hypothetical protein